MLTAKATCFTRPSAGSSRRKGFVCKANPNPLQTELNKFLEKRRAVDRERLDTLKEIADSLKTIARNEIKSAIELSSIVVPVNTIRKKCQDTKETNAESEVETEAE